MTRRRSQDRPATPDPAGDAPVPSPLRRAFAPMMDAIVILGAVPPEGLPPILYVNPAFERLCGYPAAELIGATFALLRGPGTAPKDERRVEEAIRQGRAEAVEILNVRKDGAPYWVEASMSPFFGPRGEAWTISVERDVTGRREERERLRCALEEARAADGAKSQFLAAMSHELRTPLNAVIGFSDMLLTLADAIPNPRHRQYMQDIHDAGGHLLQLVSDILDLSQIEIERMAIRPERFNLADLVLSSLRLLEHRAHAARLTLVTNIARDLPAVDADPLRLRQVILNLLTNAIKFSLPGGRIEVMVRPVAAPDGRMDGGVELRVSDTGVGMRPEDVPRALEPFVQMDQGAARRWGGVGLGLSLVKRLVDLHGGTLAIDTAPGCGMAVTVHLPAVGAGLKAPFPRSDGAAPPHAPEPNRGGG